MTVADFASWRAAARDLLQRNIAPVDVDFAGAQRGLFAPAPAPASRAPARPPVPREFLALAESVCCHTDERRFALLYRLLWRITHGERALLEDAADVDVVAARRLDKAVHRDVHKMHAFVRFRETHDEHGPISIAFHRPDFFVVERATPFFARRFPGLRWSILTPKGSAFHEQQVLRFGPPVQHAHDVDDDVEELWRTYYAAIFNPARLMTQAMTAEMPKKHWQTLPEARLIPGLIAQAQATTTKHLQHPGPRAPGCRPFVPQGRPSLAQLREAAAGCDGCALAHARPTSTLQTTQTVFGVGPDDAALVIVGEQPGDEEDRSGVPFSGPSGRLLDVLLQRAGIDRARVYVTNTVKHFRHEIVDDDRSDGRDGRADAPGLPAPLPRGKKRLHRRPTAADVKACRPWLEAELAVLRPKVLVCLGATAARALVDPRVDVAAARGRVIVSSFCPQTIVSWHPAALLRAEDGDAAEREAELGRDLQLALAALTLPAR